MGLDADLIASTFADASRMFNNLYDRYGFFVGVVVDLSFLDQPLVIMHKRRRNGFLEFLEKRGLCNPIWYDFRALEDPEQLRSLAIYMLDETIVKVTMLEWFVNSGGTDPKQLPILFITDLED